MVSLYLGGPVDFNENNYYEIIDGLISDDVPVTLFRPGLAFKTKGVVSPHYIVDVNMKAMMDADIILFFLNDSKTVGMWMEAIWALNAKKDVILYAEPCTRQSVYMRWLADMLHTKWITDVQELATVLNTRIKQKNAETFIEVTEEFTLGESISVGDASDWTYTNCKGCHHE